MKTLISIILCTFLFSSMSNAGFKKLAEPAADDPMQVHIFELDNGLQVYLSRNDERPRFFSEIVVRVGSKHDPATNTGLAHYLEHLMFKGSQQIGTQNWAEEKVYLDKIADLYEQHFKEEDPEKRNAIYAEINSVSQEAAKLAIPNEYTKVITALGGNQLNAHTSVEETVYKVSMPSSRLEAWAKLEADRFANPIFRLFHTELEIVYEEKNRAIDNPSRGVYEASGKLMYEKHPYGQWTTLGKIEHLKKPSIRTIEDYYRTWYVPNNMAVCISGDIDIDETIKVIDREFGQWEHAELPKPAVYDERPVDEVRRTTLPFPGEPYLLLGFRTVPNGHPDESACRLVDMLLDNSAAGLINLNLNQAQKVRKAGSYPYILNDYGAQYMYGVPKDNQTLEDVETLLLAQLETVKEGGFDEWLLPAILTDYKLRFQQKMENNEARVELLRDGFLQFRDWPDTRSEIDRLAKVTKAQIVAAAKKYFSAGYTAVQRIDAEREVVRMEKPQIDPLKIEPSASSAFATEITSLPDTQPEPRLIQKGKQYSGRTKDGVTFLHAPNPFNKLFTLKIIVPTGSLHDSALPYAKRLLDKAGAGEFSGSEMQTEWYKLGTTFSMDVGATETSLSISGIDDNLDASIELLLSLIKQPKVEADTFDKLLTIVRTEREAEQKDPQAVFRALLIYNRHGEQSSFLNRIAFDDLSQKVPDTLLSSVGKLLELPRTIHYTGSLEKKAIAKRLRTAGLLEAPTAEAPKRTPIPVNSVQSNRVYLLDQDNAQSLIRLEFSQGTYDADKSLEATLFREYFGGGMSSVVFQELREARSLAYSAWSWYFEPPYPDEESIVAGFIGTQADKTCDALEAFEDLFHNLPSSDDAFQETLNSLESEYRTDPTAYRDILNTVHAWSRLGIKKDPRGAYLDALPNMDMSAINAFHRANIKDQAKLISIVGKKSEIDLERLKKIGVITDITLEQIFTP